MHITTPAFQDNQRIPEHYTCSEDGVHPPLSFSDYPPDTESFCLVVDDPDAPSGIFTHWLVWNITLEHTTIPEGQIPIGMIEGTNSGGNVGYYPPCPPPGHGEHHYRFIVYALKSPLNLSAGSDRARVDQALEGLIIDKAEVIGLYSR